MRSRRLRIMASRSTSLKMAYVVKKMTQLHTSTCDAASIPAASLCLSPLQSLAIGWRQSRPSDDSSPVTTTRGYVWCDRQPRRQRWPSSPCCMRYQASLTAQHQRLARGCIKIVNWRCTTPRPPATDHFQLCAIAVYEVTVMRYWRDVGQLRQIVADSRSRPRIMDPGREWLATSGRHWHRGIGSDDKEVT